MVYYERKSEIPKAVLDYVTQRRNDIINQGYIVSIGNPRPPLIVITRS
jgi:hypothetical protein